MYRFKLKYHPEDSQKRKDECKAALQKRIEVFMKFFDEKKFQETSIDGDQSDALVKLLDSVVIYLEGGTEFDLQILEQEAQEKAEEKKPEAAEAEAKPESEAETKVKEEKDEPMAEAEKPEESVDRKRKRKDSDASGSSGSDQSDDEKDKKDEEQPKEASEVNKDEENKESEAKDEEPKTNGDSAENGENGTNGENGDDNGEEKKMEVENNEPKPRALHKTTSIFLRNLAPTITKQEVEAMCKKYPGFLRAAIADPQPERRWFRRGWITFGREVKIKEICYALNNIRLRDFELGKSH